MADLKLRNEEDVALVEDLITLPHLHEPALLHSLSRRFAEGAIYTFTGPGWVSKSEFEFGGVAMLTPRACPGRRLLRHRQGPSSSP